MWYLLTSPFQPQDGHSLCRWVSRPTGFLSAPLPSTRARPATSRQSTTIPMTIAHQVTGSYVMIPFRVENQSLWRDRGRSAKSGPRVSAGRHSIASPVPCLFGATLRGAPDGLPGETRRGVLRLAQGGGQRRVRATGAPHLRHEGRQGSRRALHRPQYRGASVPANGTMTPQRGQDSAPSSMYAEQLGHEIKGPSPMAGYGWILRNSWILICASHAMNNIKGNRVMTAALG